MTNNTSPWWTVAPSVKATRSTKPPTRGRTSTELTASKCPVKSSQSATTRCTAGATVTWGVCIGGTSLLHAEAQMVKRVAAANPPACVLKWAGPETENVELMLHYSIW